MSKKSKFEQALIIEQTVIYPTNLNKENLLKFTFLMLDGVELLRKENIEIQIRASFDQKAIEWQLKTFNYDKGFCLDKTYTFFLMPDWTIQLIHEHSTTDLGNAVCTEVPLTEQKNKALHEKIESFLSEVKNYYKMTGREGLSNRYLNTANWRGIYAKSMKEDVVKVSENRIREYLKFITRPLSTFKE